MHIADRCLGMLAAYLSCIADASGPLASGAVAVAATHFSLFENSSMLGTEFFNAVA